MDANSPDRMVRWMQFLAYQVPNPFRSNTGCCIFRFFRVGVFMFKTGCLRSTRWDIWGHGHRWERFNAVVFNDWPTADRCGILISSQFFMCFMIVDGGRKTPLSFVSDLLIDSDGEISWSCLWAAVTLGSEMHPVIHVQHSAVCIVDPDRCST